MKSRKTEKPSISGAEAWLVFAKQDAQAARTLLADGLWNLVCFHAQQSVEKALKGFLRIHTGDVPRVHSLAKLLESCSHIDRTFLRHKQSCLLLDRFYIPTRYPEAAPGSLPEGLPDKSDAKHVLFDMQKILRFIFNRLKKDIKTPLGF